MVKKLFCTLFALLGLVIGTVSAQFSRPISVGAGAGGIFALTDLSNNGAKFAFYGEADYLITPFISVGLHGEKGKLNGSGYNSEFENNYYAANVNGKVRIGQFLGASKNYSYYTLQSNTLSKILSNVYVGAGAGALKNRIKLQLDPAYATSIVDLGGEIAEDRSEIHFVIPLSVGVDIPFGRTLYGPQWAINVNYQHTLTTNDNLDGIINKNNDQYGFVSLGLKYALFNRK
ncbi:MULTISPECIES: outer membrane beta-barrel protein [unclassified Sphingobacterium]|uniref:outer membrane beta-barrel protein n=1 Tax=unclassified Sphingobacterium TaxID=2609468 RepID=UPI0025D5AE74|nr:MULTISPECIES: outer membrane beta-barrel protein [unclassified Sphingobacterium]